MVYLPTWVRWDVMRQRPQYLLEAFKRLDLPDADCLLVVPPLAHLHWPSLGVHQLQACAREAGFEVSRVYTLIDRQEGGRENIEAAGLVLDALFSRDELLAD